MFSKNSKLFKLTLMVLILVFTLTLFAGCTQTEKATDNKATTAPVATSAAVSQSTPAATTDNSKLFAGKTIKIGALLALTGSNAAQCLRGKQGLDLAAKNINAAGGILGATVEIVYADEQGTNDGCLTAHASLVAQTDIVAIIGPNRSAAIKAIEPNIRSSKISTLVNGTSPRITQFSPADPYVFNCRANDSLNAPAIANLLVNDLGCKMIGIAYNNDDYGAAAKDAAVSWLEANKVKYMAEGHNTDDKDMTGQILKFKNSGVDGILVWTHVPEEAVFLRQLKELNYTVKLGSCPSLNEMELLNLVDADVVAGYYAAVDFARDSTEPEAVALIKEAKQVYNYDASMFYVVYHDSLYVIKDAIERAKSLDREAITQALSKTSGLKMALGTFTCDTSNQNTMIHTSTIVKMGTDKTATFYKALKESK